MPDHLTVDFIKLGGGYYDDYQWIEDILKEDGQIDVNRYWACQTYYGMIVEVCHAEMPPSEYYLTNCGNYLK
jgi:hypothetical protein